MKAHGEACSGILYLSNDRTFLPRFDQAPPRDQCLRLSANFQLALLSAPLRRAAVLAGSGKVLRVRAEARKVMSPATVHCQHLNNCARRVIYLDLTPEHRS